MFGCRCLNFEKLPPKFHRRRRPCRHRRCRGRRRRRCRGRHHRCGHIVVGIARLKRQSRPDIVLAPVCKCARYWLGLLCLLGCLAGWQGRLRFHRVKGEQIITNGKQLASWDKSLILMVYIHCISFTFFTDTKCVWLLTTIQRNT